MESLVMGFALLLAMDKHSGAHGPDFFMFRERFAYYGLNLKTAHGQKRWFKHQDFTKC